MYYPSGKNKGSDQLCSKCVFVFAYANCLFSRAKAQIFNVSVLVLDEESLDELLGPGKVEQWTHWKYRTDEHNNRIATKNELERILKSHDVSFHHLL